MHKSDRGKLSLGLQVISLRLRSGNKVGQAVLTEEQEMDYSSKMNKELPPDIRVLGWCTVPADFSARHATQCFLHCTCFCWYSVKCICACGQHCILHSSIHRNTIWAFELHKTAGATGSAHDLQDCCVLLLG